MRNDHSLVVQIDPENWGRLLVDFLTLHDFNFDRDDMLCGVTNAFLRSRSIRASTVDSSTHRPQ